ncbi:Fatty acid oxidation complex subunit alpha [Tritonibacter multivorans]|uniref:Fatty acid oxidation complex subunit alpha n=1 Tax=Tritonibacter multivorans TaxID=928856 RepID=A0A0P1GXS8_9RHOB|nr:3-hydroxyacyl-CoA dehydrogenase NAD-binding domain-containing protein [Tritonibacter multivorans]MDA7422901.1 3-hydroxyacyl-CoA dehydrogenase NAD-binding domain-containing protein [Tritonibacter multivorans]CUH79118.1 Fatty acid oxidation complex subunit alpha [Tritonibacter multivorans]SFD78343.1 3-hydroxyacyl-CoA dehydrogenase [Tritonibacter multivorans]
MSVTVTCDNGIALVTIDNPPVNAASHSVRLGLEQALRQTEADDTVNAVVLHCMGRTFIAGADVKEFGQPPQDPALPDLLLQIEGASKPWVAAIHGSALGGGLETALCCHYRLAAAEAKLGLPEVQLGLLPGAGGTVRLPRLIAAERALNMISTGKPVSAQLALQDGLIDKIAAGDLLHDAVQFARSIVGKALPPTLLSRPAIKPKDTAAFEAELSKIAQKAGAQDAPKAIIQAIQNALDLPPDAALTAERRAFQILRSHPQSAAMRHVFFAERNTTKIDRLKDVAPRKISTVGVIGGGTMGAGIAAACLLSGFAVTLIERDQNAANQGAARVKATLDGSLKRGMISPAKHTHLLAALSAGADYTMLADADLVIEAVFEDLGVKQQVFKHVEAVVRPDTILATNTSYLDVNSIADATGDPSRVIGLHFFSPAHIMKLLEVVVPTAVSDAVLATAISLAKSLRKIVVLSGVCDGFIANRIMSAYRRECEYMLEDGALPWDIDTAMTEFGLPMGIFQMQDLAGLDISWAMRKRQAATRDPSLRYVDIGDKLCEQGHLGRKTGRGYYRYEDGKTARPDPEVEALILAESKRKGITRQGFAAAEIMARILSAMQTEGQRILDEGIAHNAADIDVAMINAYGFPRWRGGPMYMADTQARLGKDTA